MEMKILKSIKHNGGSYKRKFVMLNTYIKNKTTCIKMRNPYRQLKHAALTPWKKTRTKQTKK